MNFLYCTNIQDPSRDVCWRCFSLFCVSLNRVPCQNSAEHCLVLKGWRQLYPYLCRLIDYDNLKPSQIGSSFLAPNLHFYTRVGLYSFQSKILCFFMSKLLILFFRSFALSWTEIITPDTQTNISRELECEEF